MTSRTLATLALSLAASTALYAQSATPTSQGVVAPRVLQSPDARPAAPADTGAPRVFLVDPQAYVRAKAHPTPALISIVKAEADAALKEPIVPITAKSQTPPSGDKHDYMSMGAYWWPDPKSADAPYIRHDGERNPEVHALPDHTNLSHMEHNVHALALAYYLTGNQAYADRAAMHLRAWFISSDTAMNPNMNFAQAVKGHNDGRGAGILDSRDLPLALDAVGLLAGSRSWTPADDDALHSWFTRFYQWLTTSKNAHDENKAPNNHGAWFQAQVTPIELYLGHTDAARARLNRIRDERIPDQIKPNGDQPYELVRTNSFSYSSFNLSTDAFIALPLGIDLYEPAKPGAPGILTALDALLPYDSHHKWPHQQISPGHETAICPALYYASAHTGAAKYADAIKRFNCAPSADTYILSYTH